MNANQELLQKLRRQRIRMGEDDLPAPVQAESAASHTPTRIVQERQGDLQSKLNRQRQRMGESSQPVEKAVHQAQSQPVEAHVKVKQRAMTFLTGRTSSGPSLVKPGRINLCSWEDKIHRSVPVKAITKRLKEAEDVDLASQTGSLLENGSNLATIDEEERRNRHIQAAVLKDAGTCAAEYLEATSEHLDPQLHAGLEEGRGCPLGKENYQSKDAEDEVNHAKDLSEEAPAKSRKAREAECFFMWDSDDDACSLQEDPLSERQSARNQEAEEPLEFSMLDYLAELPEGVAEKLHNCLKTHEELVRRLCQRNDLLRAHIRNLRREASEVRAAPFTPSNFIARSPRSPQSPQAPLPASKGVAEVRQRRQLAETKIEVATPSDRVRIRDEQHEANLRARLQRTIRASRERVQAMQRRVQREELQVKHRFEAALHTRDGLEKSIKAALKEQGVARVRLGELEEAINIEAMRYRAKEKERDQLLEKQNALRNEIKALRNRGLKHQQRERRLQDLQCEVEALGKTYHPESPRWTL